MTKKAPFKALRYFLGFQCVKLPRSFRGGIRTVILAKNILNNIKKIWTDDMGKKEKDLKDIKIYIKPEESKAYYVINGDVSGSVWL